MAGKKRARGIAHGPWHVPTDAPIAGGDWPFVVPTNAPDCVGFNWFAVTLPQTHYSHPSEALGQAYAFEVIDGLRNPNGELEPLHLGIVFQHLGRWAKNCNHVGMSSFLCGFGRVLGEYIQTHNAGR